MSNKTTPEDQPIFPLHDDIADADSDDTDAAMAMIQWALFTLACFACAGVIAGLLG